MTAKLNILGLLVPLLLVACAPTATTQPVAPVAAAPRAVAVAGLEAVMGRNANALQAQFGTPALDVREGDARKLQFASQVCVLDAYLYLPAAGREAVVTHIDARLPDGRDMDRASCIAALMAKGQAK